MSFLFRMVAFLALLSVTPTMVELVETVGQWTVAADGGHDAPSTTEHECAGAIHVCGCCGRSILAVTEAPATLSSVTSTPFDVGWSLRAGIHITLLRPPLA